MVADVELLEVANLFAAFDHYLFDVLNGNAAVSHHNDHVIQQVVYLVGKFLLVVVLCRDDHFCTLLAALFQYLVDPFIKKVAGI